MLFFVMYKEKLLYFSQLFLLRFLLILYKLNNQFTLVCQCTKGSYFVVSLCLKVCMSVYVGYVYVRGN